VLSTTNLNNKGFEQDRPPLLQLFLLLIFLVFVVVGSGVFLANYLKLETDREFSEKRTDINPVLQKIENQSEFLLNGYHQIDSENGIYRMPIKRAKEMLSHHPNLIKALTKNPVSVRGK
jgi:flagellar basal body-associated protein FliL